MFMDTILQDNAWITLKLKFNFGIAYGKIFLTKEKIYAENIIFPIKIFEMKLAEIKEIIAERNKLTLKISDREYVSLKLRDLVSWEYEIRQGIKAIKN